jgi:hypothetical protein
MIYSTTFLLLAGTSPIIAWAFAFVILLTAVLNEMAVADKCWFSAFLVLFKQRIQEDRIPDENLVPGDPILFYSYPALIPKYMVK